ncbi:Pentatricopeptide repeat-containing protein [Nymphaea thermarum]|nr:Pentatricopeptide repeat-containing protein [Nymphaea thermarum]
MESRIFQILKKCNSKRQVYQAHAQIFLHGLQGSNLLLGSLIHLYSTLNQFQYALLVFKFAPSPNVFLYNSVIKACNQHNHQRDALFLYNNMRGVGVFPNNYTFTFLLKSLEAFEDLTEAKMMHTHVFQSGFECNVFVQNTLIDLYCKCGDVGASFKVFDEMAERDVVSWNSMVAACMSHEDAETALELFHSMPEKNIVSWNSMIAGYMKLGKIEQAQTFFNQMPERNVVTWNSMVAGYIQLRDMQTAQNIFEKMPVKSIVSWTSMVSGYAQSGDMFSARLLFDQMPAKNVVSWNAMISGYAHNSRYNEALNLFQQMLVTELQPDEVTVTSALTACAQIGALDLGRWINSYIDRTRSEMSLAVGNSLLDMYAKCGDIHSARGVFKEMTRKCIITWTSMVSGLAFNGHSREALALFDRMCKEGTQPDDVIFIAVLSACTHAGSIDEGLRYFQSMERDFHLKPRIEHYGCIVDLLSRAGKLEEALGFIMNMPMKANVVIWATLFGSCKLHRNSRVAEIAEQEILKLEHLNPAYQVLMSNVYASIGDWDDVLQIRAMMRERDIEKVPGCSSIEVAGIVHEFLVADLQHQNRRQIYETLDGLNQLLQIEGNVHCRSNNVARTQLHSTSLQEA